MISKWSSPGRENESRISLSTRDVKLDGGHMAMYTKQRGKMGEFAGWTCAAIWGLRCRRVLLSETKTDRVLSPRPGLESRFSYLQREFDMYSSVSVEAYFEGIVNVRQQARVLLWLTSLYSFDGHRCIWCRFRFATCCCSSSWRKLYLPRTKTTLS